MNINRGKQFEIKVREDFLKLPDTSIDRLYDQVSGMYGVRNICDFIAYHYPNIFYLEVKSHKGNTFPFTNLSQYDKLKNKVGIMGIRVGVILWFIDHSKVIYVPISTITKMKEDGKKSINIKDIETYNIKEIPSTEKRVFMDSNYSVLFDLQEGE